MTKTLAALLAFAMLSAVPATAATQLADSSNSALCRDDAAEGYKRPGGFCDQLDDMKSISPTSTQDACAPVADAGFRFDQSTGRLVVADVNPCYVH